MKAKNAVYICGLGLLLALYLLASGFSLTSFPYIHSDEAWLAGLSRQIAATGDFGVTESFFDLKERNPHALKIIFHSLQIVMLRLGGYEIFSFRLLSLLLAVPTLIFFYLAARRLLAKRLAALLATALLAFDIQFIYASHMARQEILLLLALVICLCILLKQQALTQYRCIALGLVSGLSVGVHPNAFILACMCIVALLARLWFQQAQLRQILLYLLTCGLAALVFVGISLLLDPQFIAHYIAYGRSEFGLDMGISGRAGEWLSFGSKLFHGISGTYYLPDLRLQLMLFPLLGGLLLCYTLVMRREQPQQTAQAATLLAAAGGVCTGIFLIGRYNQLSIVFLMPLGWLIVLYTLALFGKRIYYSLNILLLALLLLIGLKEVRPWLTYDYEDYLAQIAAYVPAEARTLGNLNSEFYFANGALLDYRNLAFLEGNGLTLADYVANRQIEYILYHSELDFIEANRPYWNIIYGSFGIAELRQFLARQCEPVGSFSNPVYGMRIVDLLGQAEYAQVTVYRVQR